MWPPAVVITMQLNLRIEGLDAVRGQLRAFSDRRYRAAVATALTRTARQVESAWQGELAGAFDRPTATTRNAVLVRRADASTLQAEVLIKDQAGPGGRAPVAWISTEEQGGERYLKKFEQALMAQGSMPAGYRAVPGPGARLDSFGNVARGQIVQVLAQLGAQFSPGYQRVISASAAKRAAKALATGRKFVAILPGMGKGGLKPGIYERRAGRGGRSFVGPRQQVERGLVAVFLFVRGVRYRPRTTLMQRGRLAAQGFSSELQRAVSESMARLQQRAAQ